MTPAWLLISFFLFTLTAVSAAGYALLLRPSENKPETPIPSLLSQPDVPSTQAALLDIFRRIGDLFPERAAQRDSARKLLLMAGFRWPSAVSTFLGIKCMTAFTLGIAGAWASVTF